MTDKSEAEMGAIRDVFEGKIICLLCEFHRQQAIRRKTASFSPEVKEQVNKLIRELAHQGSQKDYDKLKKILASYLKANKLDSFQSYMESQWYNCEQQWAQHLRADSFHAGATTNNLVESVNSHLKNIFKGFGRLRLDVFLRTCLHEVFVELERKYLEDNMLSFDLLQKSHFDPPLAQPLGLHFLQFTVNVRQKHLSNVLENSHKIPASSIQVQSEEISNVKSASGSAMYTVNTHGLTCTCKFFITEGFICKHLCAVFFHKKKPIPNFRLMTSHVFNLWAIDRDALLELHNEAAQNIPLFTGTLQHPSTTYAIHASCEDIPSSAQPTPFATEPSTVVQQGNSNSTHSLENYPKKAQEIVSILETLKSMTYKACRDGSDLDALSAFRDHCTALVEEMHVILESNSAIPRFEVVNRHHRKRVTSDGEHKRATFYTSPYPPSLLMPQVNLIAEGAQPVGNATSPSNAAASQMSDDDRVASPSLHQIDTLSGSLSPDDSTSDEGSDQDDDIACEGDSSVVEETNDAPNNHQQGDAADPDASTSTNRNSNLDDRSDDSSDESSDADENSDADDYSDDADDVVSNVDPNGKPTSTSKNAIAQNNTVTSKNIDLHADTTPSHSAKQALKRFSFGQSRVGGRKKKQRSRKRKPIEQLVPSLLKKTLPETHVTVPSSSTEQCDEVEQTVTEAPKSTSRPTRTPKPNSLYRDFDVGFTVSCR